MGFTRTSEGRVFFQGAGNDDAPRFDAPTTPEPAVNVDQTQMQILLLLKSLNTKLKSSKEEQAAMKKQLSAYKSSLRQIRDKTGSYETNYIDLEQQLARKQTEAQKQVTRVEETLKDTLKQLEEARKLVEELESKSENSTETLETLKNEVEERKKEEERLLKRQKDLEKAQSSQGEKMVDHVAAYVALTKRVSESEARQASLDNKIEENTSEYLKLDRKIDKAVEDRNRILRKIERIESAVMETRDALNAKAMVLLTQQQGTSNQTAVEYPQIAEETARMDMETANKDAWWKKSVRLNTASLSALVLAVLAAGWLISGAFNSTSSVNDVESPIQKTSRVAPPFETTTSSTKVLPLKTELNPRYSSKDDVDTAALEPEMIRETLPKFNPAPDVTEDDYGITIHNGTNQEQPNESKSVNLDDEKQMLALMEREPQKLAEELNKIEPTAFTPAAKEVRAEKKIDLEDPAPNTPIARTPSEAEFYKSSLRKQISPDSNLNDVTRRIETQAFEGIPEAQHDMGAIYVAGHGPIKQDLKRAVFWFEEAAKNGVANAQYNLGVLYHQGMGIEKDVDRAIALYQKAANQGHPEAQYNLGIANIEGIGVPYNPQKAAIYFENAANKNIMEAAYNLGLIYENGLLGATHPDEALMWYKTAADNGSPEAKAALEQLANSLGIAMSDVNRVVEKTRMAKKGNTESADKNSQQHITGEIQKELMARGLYPGPVDGMNGPMTANAIKNYQQSSSLAADGIPSKDLLNYMRSARN